MITIIFIILISLIAALVIDKFKKPKKRGWAKSDGKNYVPAKICKLIARRKGIILV